MSAKKYYRSMGQSDAARGYRMPTHKMRDWPQWAFDAYAWGWLQG